MQVRVTDPYTKATREAPLEEFLADNLHDLHVVAEVTKLLHGAQSVQLGGGAFPTMIVERVDRPTLPDGRVWMSCRFCNAEFPDPPKGECPYCLSRYIAPMEATVKS